MADENLQRFLTHLFRLRLRYPREDISNGSRRYDISGAFRWVGYQPRMALAFASVVYVYLEIPTRLIFGAENSALLYIIPAELRAHIATREVRRHHHSSDGSSVAGFEDWTGLLAWPTIGGLARSVLLMIRVMWRFEVRLFSDWWLACKLLT